MASLLTTTRQKKKKMNRKRLSILVLLLLTMGRSLASDSTFVLSKEGFLSIVRSYHPVLKIAGLQVRRAAAEVQQARGAFDRSYQLPWIKKPLTENNITATSIRP